MILDELIVLVIKVCFFAQVVLFAIELALLAARDVAAVGPGVCLLLPADGIILMLQMTIIATKMAVVVVYAVVNVVVSAQYFCSAGMILSEFTGESGTARQNQQRHRQ